MNMPRPCAPAKIATNATIERLAGPVVAVRAFEGVSGGARTSRARPETPVNTHTDWGKTHE